MRFESSSNSLFVLLVSFVVALFALHCSQCFEWRTERLRNMSDPSLLGGDRLLESQTIGPCQHSRSSLHRDADVFAPSRSDLHRVWAPRIV